MFSASTSLPASQLPAVNHPCAAELNNTKNPNRLAIHFKKSNNFFVFFCKRTGLTFKWLYDLNDTTCGETLMMIYRRLGLKPFWYLFQYAELLPSGSQDLPDDKWTGKWQWHRRRLHPRACGDDKDSITCPWQRVTPDPRMCRTPRLTNNIYHPLLCKECFPLIMRKTFWLRYLYKNKLHIVVDDCYTD